MRASFSVQGSGQNKEGGEGRSAGVPLDVLNIPVAVSSCYYGSLWHTMMVVSTDSTNAN